MVFEHEKKYSEAIRQARLSGLGGFLNWFNKCRDVRQSVIRGYWDFTIHILTSKVCEQINCPEDKVALEIGYGGGRILNAACSYFKEAIGIDIHNEQETVIAFLQSQGKNNFKLIKTSGEKIDLASESIDFIYSFIVLQHLPTFDVFISYLKETYRCLKQHGVAQLYFGKWSKLASEEQSKYLFQGYKEIQDAPVNYTSLVVHVSKVEILCKEIGFKILDIGTSYKTVPDGYKKREGGQNYITLLKD